MVVHIVMDKSKGVMKSYADKHKTFADPEKALAHAKECGFSTFFMTPSFQVGYMSSYQAGDVHVEIMTVEVEE